VTTLFSDLDFDTATLANLDSLAYREMTPIQAQALPPLLAGRDLIGQAKTGSGKTVAFGLALLQAIDRRHFSAQALVLCPTRELADQVAKELRRLARGHANTKILTLCGGSPFGPQLASLAHGAHIIVGTPGRILKHLRKQSLDLSGLRIVTLDEADRMLDMGFHDDMVTILSETPRQRQTLLFSATFPEGIRELSAAFQNKPVEVTIQEGPGELKIEQRFYEVQKASRLESLVALLAEQQPASCVVFCNTRQDCQEVGDLLKQRGLSALALHGDLEQWERDQVLVRFANKSISVLVATDVAARGLDIKELEAVINLELPQDPEVYVHRIGRTGRAGKSGLALSLFTPSEVRRLTAIEDYLGVRTVQHSAPETGSDIRPELTPTMSTLSVDGGRKQKLRPGDLLGALTANNAIPASQVGSIDIFENISYVAVESRLHRKALKVLNDGNIKGRRFRVRHVR